MTQRRSESSSLSLSVFYDTNLRSDNLTRILMAAIKNSKVDYGYGAYLPVWAERLLSVLVPLPSSEVLLSCSIRRDSLFRVRVLLLCFWLGSALLAAVPNRLGGTAQGSRCSPPTCLQENMNTNTHGSEQNTQTQQQSPGEPLSAHIHPLVGPFCLSGSPQSISSARSSLFPFVALPFFLSLLSKRSCFLSFSSLLIQPPPSLQVQSAP